VNQESNNDHSGGSRCPYCGHELTADVNFCRQCGREVAAGDRTIVTVETPPATSAVSYESRPETAPDNYLVWAILATIFCCMPFGIVAIVYAAQVNSHVAAGNYIAARNASDSARKWCLVSLIAGLAIPILYFLFFALAGILSYTAY
jgi:uncharacterized membrane protein YvbJ